jgi:single-stranded-DNA-specific exonuclease
MVAVRKRRDDDAPQAGGAFLGVTHSAKGFVWQERLQAHDAAQADAIVQRLGVPHVLGRILAARGVTADTAALFMDPTIKALMPDPSILKGLDVGAGRLADAVQRGEKVAVFGDYDVDGASSSALLARFFGHHGNACRIYIPDRLFEGYGPNATAIGELAKDGAQLIITADCGTTSFEPLAAAAKYKVDVVVIDHHQADERLPDVVSVINPNRQDDLSGLGHLCAAGVVFMTLVGVVRELRRRGHYANGKTPPDLLSMLDLVALATVCDVVPLKTLNRAFVTKGLQVMRSRGNAGLRALYDAAGLDQVPTPYHLGFGLGSRLLALDEDLEAAKIAATLDRLNRERRAIEQEMLAEAMSKAEAMLVEAPDLPILIVGSETWHKGVVGLVSSRLTDRFRRPSCVIAWNSGEGGMPKGQGTGSLRSVSGVDIGGAVRAAVAAGHLDKGGGHAMAAGLTVSTAKFETLSAYLITKLQATSTAARMSATLEVDGAMTPASATSDFMDLVEKAGPFGQGNPTPRFVFPAHRVKFAKIVGESHVRCSLEAGDGARLDAVAFRAAGQPVGDALLGSNGASLHIAGTLKRDTWSGRNRLELTIDDVADPSKRS